MATNRFYQRYGFIKGKSFTKMNHFSDKGNGLDPVSVDLQKKKDLVECPSENSFQKSCREWGGW